MGSVFSNIGHALKKGVIDTGHFVGKAASNPFVDAGLGLLTGGIAVPALAGLAGGLLKPGGNIGQGVLGGAEGALAGGVGKGIGGAVRGAIPAVLGGGGKGLGGIDLGALVKSIPGASSLGLTGGNGPGGIDIGQLANYGLGGAALVNAAKLQGQSSKYATDALDQAKQAYGERGGLRTAGIQNMLNPSAGINLGGLSQIAQHGNPFARGVAPPQVGGIQVGQMGGAGGGLPSQVLGQAASPDQAQQAMGNVNKYMQGGVGNLAGILRAAQGAV